MTRPGPAARGPAGRRQPAGRTGPGGPAGTGRGPAGRGGAGEADRFAPAYRIVTLRTPDGPLRARLDPSVPQPHVGTRPVPSASRAKRPPPGPVRRFVRTWGWRAYAVPLLTVLSVLCGIDVANGSEAGMPLVGSPAPTAVPAPVAVGTPAPPAATTAPAPKPKPTPTGIYVDDAGGGTSRPLPPTALPAGAAYTQRGGGRFDPVPGESTVYGTGPLHRFTVEVEAGVGADGPAFAAAVERTLSDPRSWGHDGAGSFQRVATGPVDFRVSLTASLTVRSLCGYELPYETSCYNGEEARVVINHARWVRGAVSYGKDLAGYRLYVVNHEVGHALGNAHVACPRRGAGAPVMMQQTLGITTPGVGACRPNPWPFP